MKEKKVAVIMSTYNGEKFIREQLDSILNQSYKNIDLIVRDDGSKDKTLSILRDFAKQDKRVRYISFSRNFGHEAAVCAGLMHSTGDVVIVMDADLQDPPEVIPELIKKWEEGYQVVNARRASRKEDSFLKRKTAGMFYAWSDKISHKIKVPQNVANFRLIDRRPLSEILEFGEKNRVFRIQVPYVGFKVCEVLFSRPKRVKGVSKYNPKSMFSLAISSTISLTVRPLEWSIGICFVVAAICGLSWLSQAVFFILDLTNGDNEIVILNLLSKFLN